MSVKVTINKSWKADLIKGSEVGLLEMVTDVDKRSAILAPKASRALVNSRLIEKTGEAEYRLSYGSDKVPYARRRHYENKKNPQTIGYLSKAAEEVARGDTSKYFRGKV